MLVEEIVSRVKTLYNKGVESYDSRLPNRYVYSKAKTIRSRILVNEVKKKQFLGDWAYQYIPCIKLKAVPSHECDCIPSQGCTILRSEEKIPEILTNKKGYIVSSVSTIDGSVVFDVTTKRLSKYQSGLKYGKNKKGFYFHDGYLYITHDSDLSVISISAIFNDPLEVENFVQYCENDESEKCIDNMKQDMHIEGKLAESIIQLTAEEMIYAFAQMTPDDIFDAIDQTSSSIRNPSSYRYEANRRYK